jgi:hypothetical protein
LNNALDKAGYSINNKTVSEKEFNKFKDSLKEIKGTWFCAETNTGGTTGYDAKNNFGTIYEIRFTTDDKVNSNSIQERK